MEATTHFERWEELTEAVKVFKTIVKEGREGQNVDESTLYGSHRGLAGGSLVLGREGAGGIGGIWRWGG